MSAIPLKRSGHLSIVEIGQGSEKQSKIISPEQFSAQVATTAAQYVEFTKLKGTLVGAMCGSEPWDVRPLLLDQNELKLIRTTDPGWVLDKQKLALFRKQIGLYIARPLFSSGIVSYGEAHGQMWICRKYMHRVLSDWQSDDSDAIHPVLLARKIVSLLEAFHAGRFVHGHLAPSNVVIEQGEITFLDYPFSFLTASTNLEIAPEVRGGLLPSEASDIYGLGIVLRRVLSSHLTPEIEQFLSRLVAHEPHLRPTLKQVRNVLGMDGEALIFKASANGQHQAELKGGKVLGLATGDLSLATEPIIPASKFSKQVPRELLAEVRQQLSDDLNLPQKPLEAVVATPRRSLPPIDTERLLSVIRAAADRHRLIQRIGIGVGVVVVAFLLFHRDSNNAAGGSTNGIDYAAYWSSAQPSLMQRVAHDAVLEPYAESAQAVIVNSAFAGKQPSQVRARLLKVAFNPLWEADLSHEDRVVALRLSLAEFVPESFKDLPPLSEVHPGVILAVLAQLDITGPAKQFAAISVDTLGTLPGYVGVAYSDLAKIGVQNISDVAARALSHIVSGDVTEENVRFFLNDHPASKIKILLPMLTEDKVPGLAATLLRVLESSQSKIGSVVRWFTDEKLAGWDKVDERTRFLLTLGLTPENDLSAERYADLLSFPRSAIREMAAQKLSAMSHGELEHVIPILVSSQSKLSRSQIISLLASFMVKGTAGDSFIGTWFNTQPDPQTVAMILAARSDTPENDTFNLEAARYLIPRNWDADFSMINKLALHKEPLARALAYSRLDPAKPQDAHLLKQMAVVEPNPKIRAKILEKLQQATENSTEE